MDELAGLTAHLEDALRKIFGIFFVAGERLANNTKESFAQMDATKWIRVIMIVGAYLLLRPHLLKSSEKAQGKQFEKEHEDGKMSPNDLRGVKKEIPDASDDDDDEGTAATQTTTEWGKKARKRQRVMLKKMIAAEEQRLQELQEDDEDKDIEQYLVG